MAIIDMGNDVYEVGAAHWDRELFDELIPLPDGTSYNSYIVKGSEKTVLIDTVDPEKEDVFLKNLNRVDVDKIDYIISHHAEQDHSGCIPLVLTIYPKAKVVTNDKNKQMLMDHLGVEEDRFKVIEDGDELSIGDRTFEFMYMPWVHWPETMVSYLKEDKILFSCDFFGSHLATSHLFVRDEDKVYLSAKRYYAEIMMPFRKKIQSHLEKVRELDIDIIATSHGPIYDDPEFILDAYEEWTSDIAKDEVIVPYVSMHGSTEKMVNHFVDTLMEKGKRVTPYNLTTTDIGELAMSLVDAGTIVLGTPTVLVGPHPKAVYAAYLANALRPKTKYASIIGSYGWGGRMPEMIKDSLSNLKVEFLEPVVIKGHPTEEDYKELDRLAEDIVKKHEDSDEIGNNR